MTHFSPWNERLECSFLSCSYKEAGPPWGVAAPLQGTPRGGGATLGAAAGEARPGGLSCLRAWETTLRVIQL